MKLIKSFRRGVQGGRLFQKESPLAAGGKSDGEFSVGKTLCYFLSFMVLIIFKLKNENRGE